MKRLNRCFSGTRLAHNGLVGGSRPPLLALSGHRLVRCTCPLLGVERTWLFAVRMSANDPKRTVPLRPDTMLILGVGQAMRRREFLTLLGGAPVARPVASQAQQVEPGRRVGVLYIFGPEDPEAKIRTEVFEQALQQLGWTVGRNLKLDVRLPGGDRKILQRFAAELVSLAPDVLVSVGSATIASLQQETRTIPIVFVNVADPVGAGFVQSLSRPGGNTTGFTNFEYSMSGKWVELLRQIAPHVTQAAVLRDTASAAGIGQLGAIQSVASSVGMELTLLSVRDPEEIERGVTTFARVKNRGLIVTS